MKVAVPLNSTDQVYRDNPFTAPKFAIYHIDAARTPVIFTLEKINENPWLEQDGEMFSDTMMCSAGCSDMAQKDFDHIIEHYALLEAVSGCSYMLVKTYCDNIKHTMRNGGVELFNIPPFIKEPSLAIKNFLIGANIASSIQYIQHEA